VVSTPSKAGLARLVAEVAADLRVDPTDLPDVLRPLVEAGPSTWEKRYGTEPRLAVKLSAILAMGALGLPRCRLVDDVSDTARYQALANQLALKFPERAAGLEAQLRTLVELVPRPVDLTEIRRVLEVCFEGRVPSSLSSVLELLGAPAPVVVGGEVIDPVEAARRIVEHPDPSFVLGLLESDLLPHPVATWTKELLSRHGERRALAPSRVFAGLPAEVGALVAWCSPDPPAQWASAAKAISHIARLARVLDVQSPPSLWPSQHLLGQLAIGPDQAAAYEDALRADVEALSDELVEERDLSDVQALERARKRLMQGFQPFVGYLESARDHGAPVVALPKPLAVERRSTKRYQGMREEICPRPEVALALLALAPELLAEEPDGRLVIVQLISGARASVVLSLRRSWVAEVPEGLLFYVPWQANKTGRGMLFIPSALVEYYGISPQWLPEKAPRDPPQYRRDELAGAIDRLCKKFEARTRIRVAHTSVRFTRAAVAQLYRRHLHGTDREAITALLGHRDRTTRANYLRAWPEELDAALGAWRF